MDGKFAAKNTFLCCAVWLTDDIWKQSRLKTEFESENSNTADNIGITQSQERDTRHRRMQEVNSLCTDSGPLQAEYRIVPFHTIQPSSFGNVFVSRSFRLR